MLQHPLPCYFSFYCSLAATGNVLAGIPTLATQLVFDEPLWEWTSSVC